jgi:two-component system response regulator RpfG
MTTLIENTNFHQLLVKIMIIDDQLTSRIILETVVRSIGSNITVDTYDNAISALSAAAQEPPDLILADYKMPELDGVEFTRRLRCIPACLDVPVVIITIVDEKSIMYRALEAGATDFLTKPIDHYECKVRCKNLLTMRRQQQIIRNRAKFLEAQVNKAVQQIHTREKETLFRLARAGEYKDTCTGMHQSRMGRISGIIASQIGMDSEFCETIELAAPLHDIGKIGIPDNILLKPDLLDHEEMEIMKTHTIMGYEILKDSPSQYLQMGAVIALNHHERYDGSGYPSGISQEQIPLAARIAATADVFDSLASERPYKKAWGMDQILRELNNQKRKQLDPACVIALFKRLDEVISVQQLSAAN